MPHAHCRKGGEQRKHKCWGSEWYLGDSTRERVQSIWFGNVKIRSEPYLHCLLSSNSGQFIQLLPGWSFSAANGSCLPCSLLAQRPVGRIRWAKYKRILWALNHLTKVWDDLFCSLKCQSPSEQSHKEQASPAPWHTGPSLRSAAFGGRKEHFPLLSPCWHTERKSTNTQLTTPAHFSEEKLLPPDGCL